MKKLFYYAMMAMMMFGSAVVLSSCEKSSDDETDSGEVDTRINQVIPKEYRQKMEKYMAIYDGVNPPNIEGVYTMSPSTNVYDDTGYFSAGDVTTDVYLRFYNQNMSNNIISYEDYSGGDYEEATGAFISGDNNNFSVYFNTSGTSGSATFKLALVVSGTKASNGIRNLYYAFVMTDKKNDTNNQLMDVGGFRIFKDGDGLAEPSSWPSFTRSIADQIVAKGLLKRNQE